MPDRCFILFVPQPLAHVENVGAVSKVCTAHVDKVFVPVRSANSLRVAFLAKRFSDGVGHRAVVHHHVLSGLVHQYLVDSSHRPPRTVLYTSAPEGVQHKVARLRTADLV